MYNKFGVQVVSDQWELATKQGKQILKDLCEPGKTWKKQSESNKNDCAKVIQNHFEWQAYCDKLEDKEYGWKLVAFVEGRMSELTRACGSSVGGRASGSVELIAVKEEIIVSKDVEDLPEVIVEEKGKERGELSRD